MNAYSETRRSWLWWIYAAYLVLAFAAAIYNGLHAAITPMSTFVFVLDTAAAVGFYGFLRKRIIFSLAFWQLFALAYTAKYIAVIALLSYVATHLLPDGGLTKSSILWMVVGNVMVLPEIYALYIYAFRSARLWNAKRSVIAE